MSSDLLGLVWDKNKTGPSIQAARFFEGEGSVFLWDKNNSSIPFAGLL